MQKRKIESLQHFIDIVEIIDNERFSINIYRGQSDDSPLLPSIARDKPSKNTSEVEKEMLNDLERRSQLLLKKKYKSDWEWLVLAQHFDMKTRLLDWTSNPLAALW